MRIRSIKPEFFQDEDVAELPTIARLLFIGLWGLADRRGRIIDSPKRIKINALPYDDADVDALLALLHERHFITRYSGETDKGERKIIQVNNFERHQRINGKEAMEESILPPPPPFERSKAGIDPEKQQGSDGEAMGKRWGSSRDDGRERKGRERKGIKTAEASLPAVITPSYQDRLKEFFDSHNLKDGKPFYGVTKQAYQKEAQGRKRFEVQLRARCPPGDDELIAYTKAYLGMALDLHETRAFPMAGKPITAAYLSSDGVVKAIDGLLEAERSVQSAEWVEQYERPAP